MLSPGLSKPRVKSLSVYINRMPRSMSNQFHFLNGSIFWFYLLYQRRVRHLERFSGTSCSTVLLHPWYSILSSDFLYLANEFSALFSIHCIREELSS